MLCKNSDVQDTSLINDTASRLYFIFQLFWKIYQRDFIQITHSCTIFNLNWIGISFNLFYQRFSITESKLG